MKSGTTDVRLVTHLYRDRPELWERLTSLSEAVWPEYNRHGERLNAFWPRLYDTFPEFQFVLYDEASDEVLGEGHTIPCRWDGTLDDLPSGIDSLIEQGFRLRDEGGEPNALSALAIEILPDRQSRGLSPSMLQGMQAIAAAHRFGDLIAPVRPNWKERYPITAIERYMCWTRDDGLPFDPWIRVHARLGATILKAAPRSLLITGTVHEWEQWTEMAFPDTGRYVFPAGLAPVDIDREADKGVYWEPNVWMRHGVR